jgi:hypothetical protein
VNAFRRVSQPQFINTETNINIDIIIDTMSSIHIDKISLSTFNATLSRYADTAPSTLADLDELRYTTIPARLAKIEKNAQLSKSDVEKLVEWKL